MKKSLLFLLLCLGGKAIAQDIHFSQAIQTPLWINPALTGVYEGWERVTVNHRSQWLGTNTQFSTTAVSGDINFFKSAQNDKAHLGLGVFMWHDAAGDAKYGTRQGQLSLSGILPMGGGHQFSVGLQGGVGNRGGNMSALYFGNQWNGDEFDNALPNLEQDRLRSDNYFNVSTGINYQFERRDTRFAHDEYFKVVLGAAVYHANQPTIKYGGLANEDLYRKFVFHGRLIKDFSGSQWAIDASAVQFIQGPQYQTLMGALLRYRMSSGGKITTFKQDAYIAFGMYHRWKDAVIPAFMLELRGFQFGISYDFTISPLRNTHGGGSLEFSLSYRNLYTALFKTRRR
jgi:type IX secretion system PorP/SprF family membrane protein